MTADRTTPGGAEAPRHEDRIAIEDVSSWVLRIGVVASVLILLVGLGISLRGGELTKRVMETQTFVVDFAALWRGVRAFQGFAWLELGILVLVITPIVRVFTAMALFAIEERDLLYTSVTFFVLVMTLGSLLFIR